MTLVKLEACCKCPEHARPYVNEDGWVITGLPDKPETWEAFMPAEWRRHCSRYSPISLRLEIAKRLKAGENVNDLATEYGITPRTIQRYRRWYAKVAA
jgi:hypothetical protein